MFSIFFLIMKNINSMSSNGTLYLYSLKISTTRSKEILEFIHNDICDSLQTRTYGVAHLFYSFH
jgi:hypothetical protein